MNRDKGGKRMSKIKENKLVRMTNEAAKNASESLSKLSDEKVSVEVSKAEITKVHGKFPDIKPESIVAGIYLPITGDVKGASLLIFPEKVAYTLSDVLVRRKAGALRR